MNKHTRGFHLPTSAVALLGAVALASCSKKPDGSADGSDASPATKASPRLVQLPPPFAAIHLGMSRSELEAKFSPEEDLSACAPRLVGGDAPLPKRVPGAEKESHSRCARSLE